MSAGMKLLPLRTSSQFRAVYDRGVRFHTPFFSIFILPNSVDEPRLGITVTRKIGPAVTRNRCKRRLREVAKRHMLPLFAGVGCDVVVNVKTAMLAADVDELSRQFARTLLEYSETIARRGGEATQ